MKFSEKTIVRDLKSVYSWRSGVRADLDPEFAKRLLDLFHEIYAAAEAHPDWAADGEKAFCVEPRSRQKNPRKLLKWYRALPKTRAPGI